jgi:hypothetical protein
MMGGNGPLKALSHSHVIPSDDPCAKTGHVSFSIFLVGPLHDVLCFPDKLVEQIQSTSVSKPISDRCQETCQAEHAAALAPERQTISHFVNSFPFLP